MSGTDDGCIRSNESTRRRTLFYLDIDYDDVPSSESQNDFNVITTPTTDSSHNNSNIRVEQTTTPTTNQLQATDPNPVPGSTRTPAQEAERTTEYPNTSSYTFDINQRNIELKKCLNASREQGYIEIGESSRTIQSNTDENIVTSVEIHRLLRKIDEFIEDYESSKIFKDMVFWYLTRNDPTYYYLLNERPIVLDPEPYYVPPSIFQHEILLSPNNFEEFREYDVTIPDNIFNELDEDVETSSIPDLLGGGDNNGRNVNDRPH